ncbi:MAG: LutB/LldF family L-lactate oxidation iron-sulfur protein [Desulfosarcinaceae bacterium]|nr:LutB/LldF family L-lactate oxidation iron-sulfur protein [Desulfosarcinaceae bacterium]
MSAIRTEAYCQAAREGMADPVLQKALSGFQHRVAPATAQRYRRHPEGPQVRQMAHAIRMHAVEHLDTLLPRLADGILARGGQVYFAADAQAAVAYGLAVARRRGVRQVVKGKSMVTEEIGLNEAFQDAGIAVVETDLGEYILQLAGETPSHIIAPAIHKTRKEVGRLFAEKLGIPYSEDPPTLTQAARAALRTQFLSADMGVSGCNLACAETGHITTVSNEGNIRMSTTLPKVHIAFMGMERVVARLADHALLFRLLSNAAAAQKMAGYISYIGGPRADFQADGPEEFHLVIVDNGRSRILADPEFREILCCIRCAACLNVCPVYGKIGGHAYGYAYSGPVGAVVTALLVGLDRAKHLFFGETLCGACKEACPVEIDLPRLLLALRHRWAEGRADDLFRGGGDRLEALVMRLWGELARRPNLYQGARHLAVAGQQMLPAEEGRITRLPPPLHGWTQARDLPRLARRRFVQRWAAEQARGEGGR